MNSVGIGKTIYFGFGPALYLGLWLILTSQSADFIRIWAIDSLYLCLALCALSLSLSFLVLKIHLSFNVPVMKRNGVYDSHKRFVWFYSLVINVPACIFGLASMTVFTIVPVSLMLEGLLRYVGGWFLGAALGTFLGYMFLAFSGPIFVTVTSWLFCKPNKTIAQREATKV